MPLKSDEQGFLVGIPIEVSSVLKVWRNIAQDVKDIKSALNINNPSRQKTVVGKSAASNRKGTDKPAPSSSTAVPNRQKRERTSAAQKSQNSSVRSTEKKPAEKKNSVVVAVTRNPTKKAIEEAERKSQNSSTPAGQRKQNNREGNSSNSPSTAVVEARRKQNEQRKKTVSGPEVGSTGRDAKGRFVKKDTSGFDEAQQRLRDTDLAGKIASAVKDAEEGLQETDPTIKAIQEVATPLARGYESLFKSDESEESNWLKKIFKSFTRFRKDDQKANKATDKRLKAIEKKDLNVSGKSSGSIFDGLKGLVSGGAGGVGGGLLVGLPKLLGAGIKKIPLIGGAITSLMAAFSIYKDENDTTLTDTEKRKRHGKNIGGAAGGIAGMVGGAKLGAAIGALGGPIGSAIGVAVGGIAGGFFGDSAGSIIGEKIGSFTNNLIAADIPGKISGVWTSFTDSLRGTWDDVTGKMRTKWDEVTTSLSNLWEKITAPFTAAKEKVEKVVDSAKEKAVEVGNQVNNFVKDKTGFDVKASASALAEKAGEKVDFVKNKASHYFKKGRSLLFGDPQTTVDKDSKYDFQPENKSFLDRAKEKISAIGNFAKNKTFLGSAASNWQLGETSKRFESGRGGAGTISSGKGDFGGVSYGTYQLASKTGTLSKFLKSSGYGKHFEGMQAGTKEFNQKWKELAANDPEFGNAQHEFIKNTHYDVAMQKLGKNGIDLSNRGRAVQDALWSTSVQFGAGGASNMFKKVLKGKDVSQLSDSEIVTLLQDYKIQNNDRLFGSSSASVRAGTLNRAQAEKAKLLNLAANDVKGESSNSAIASAVQAPPAVKAANAPIPQIEAKKPEPAPTVPSSVATNTKPKVQTVRLEEEVGQDVGDRRIAHIVTGGFADA